MAVNNKLIVTTSWDDGTVYDLKVAELLSKYGVKGTFYIPKFYFDCALKEHDITEIDKYHEIGSHTLNHMILTRVSLSEAEKEVRGSKAYLEDLLGHKVDMLAYPNGEYNKHIKKIVKEAAFVAARTCKPGGFKPPSDPYQWKITMLASNGSPLMALKIWLKTPIALQGYLDWETRAKLLFDKALKAGGIYHIYGHAEELERKHQWDKLERVLDYISGREGVHYMTNGEIFQRRWRREV